MSAMEDDAGGQAHLQAFAIEDHCPSRIPSARTDSRDDEAQPSDQPSVAIDSRYDMSRDGCRGHSQQPRRVATGMGIRQIVDGESGLLVDEYDAQAMGDRIVTLSSDPTLRNRLGRAAWLRAREMFSAGMVRAQWLDLLGLSRYAEENLSPGREL
jgi:hypothetical protein